MPYKSYLAETEDPNRQTDFWINVCRVPFEVDNYDPRKVITVNNRNVKKKPLRSFPLIRK